MENLIQKIFSIRNDKKNKHKIINILGIKIKINTETQKMKIKRLERETSALRTLFNDCIDITKVPKARGDLRKLQITDTEFLKIFDKICKINSLQYWLDGGTLLGAVRHKGFIPWDDDIDIGMLREDYNRAIQVFKNALDNKIFEVNEGKGFCRKVLRLSLKNSPVQIDIWPFEKFNKNNLTEQEKDQLRDKIHNCNTLFWNHFSAQNIDKGIESFPRKEITEFTNKYILENNLTTCENPVIFRGAEAWLGERCVYDWSDMFPLKTTTFENTELFVPNNPEIFLEKYYGDYMKLPDLSQAICGHENISKNLVSLDKSYKILQDIYNSLK